MRTQSLQVCNHYTLHHCIKLLYKASECFAENALVVIVKYINNEANVPAIISGSSELASGIHLRTGNESRHILQLIVSGKVDGPKEYSESSRINAANQQLLEQLLQRVYRVRGKPDVSCCSVQEADAPAISLVL